MSTTAKLKALADRWASAKAAERANAQSYLIELCTALGVEPPRPAGTGYEFEFPIKVVARDGTESTNFVDLYKAHHFALEAKDEEAGKSTDMLLRKAFGQLRGYVGHLPHERPPYLMVLDVGRTLIVWERWDGDYGGFNAGRRIDLTKLADRLEDIDLLRDIWANPTARDPRSKSIAVTKELAEQLAELAAELEREGFEQERVARFLMRCVFTMFAEDVGLLPGEPFRHIIDDVALKEPAEFVPLATELWKAMDEGKRFLLRKLLRFNGHFFKDAEALPLNREALALLLTASQADWAHVEPTIFGTLLTRALDPAERHKLGAEYTPREYVERVVRPTVEEPIRERWTLVQAEVLQLRESGKKKDLAEAEKRLREFHDWLQGLRFLDPACGSGNFLYVTMHIVKRIELEAIRLLDDLTGKPELRIAEVGPWQFHGIEVKPWAREIAELTLWIGFHQFWKEHHSVQPPEPVLQDTGTLEWRDAVLKVDKVVIDPSKSRPDPTPRIKDPVTGRMVPDPKAVLQYEKHVNPRQAPWPNAHFIIGNPPYIGKSQKRKLLGDGYVDALQEAYPELPPAVDFVMFWWHRAAEMVAAGKTIRAGLITTNSIRQRQNRSVLEAAEKFGAHVAWAIPDHPWVDGADGAAVRVAMTVIAADVTEAVSIAIDKAGNETVRRGPRMNSDLTIGAEVARAGKQPLLANKGLATVGFKLYGDGFILEPGEPESLRKQDPSHAQFIREYFIGRDITARPRGLHIIDFGTLPLSGASKYPVLLNLVKSRVKRERDANPNKDIKSRWWQLGHNRVQLRGAIAGLSRFIITPETSKHRFFQSLPPTAAPEGSLFCIASDSAALLAMLSSSQHVIWANRAAGAMGKGNDPRYVKGCFDAFPFPTLTPEMEAHLADLGERLDALRKKGLAADPSVTMTGMYNVVAKLRSGETLTTDDKKVHTLAACGVLKDLHDEIDAAMAQALGWAWPMDSEDLLLKLVDAHDQRLAAEGAGQVAWLRPTFQVPLYGKKVASAAPTLGVAAPPPAAVKVRTRPWPSTAIEQISALKKSLERHPGTVDELAARFKGAKRELVQRHVDTLVLMGELEEQGAGRFSTPKVAA